MFNFFKKTGAKNAENSSLKQRLNKTKLLLGSGLSALLLGKKTIDDALLEELETLLITADVGIQTTDMLLQSVRKNASRKTLKDTEALYNFLKIELSKLLIEDNILQPKSQETFVILVVGVNGAGKTTTIGKLAKHFQKQGKSVMLAAGDTFRAAAVEQLQVWGQRNDCVVVSQKTGADAAAVIFDAYQSAQAKNIDILIADTAGRLHTQDNLMQELAKIKRVIGKQNQDAPHEVMLVVDGSSGQNALVQAKAFNKSVQLSGISISKLDGTAKGGIVFAIANELGLPIRYIGIGETDDDLKPFIANEFIDALFEG